MIFYDLYHLHQIKNWSQSFVCPALSLVTALGWPPRALLKALGQSVVTSSTPRSLSPDLISGYIFLNVFFLKSYPKGTENHLIL